MRILSLITHLAALLMLGCGAAVAAQVADLYEARTIVTSQEEGNRARGFAECLEKVLAKVSGDPRLIGDPAVAVMTGQAAAFVSGFRYHDRMSGIPIHDEQGSRDRPYDLTVSFHPGKIDAALRTLGREPWSASRPRVAVFLGVGHETTNYLLARDDDRGHDQRDALAAAARQFGMPMVLPTQAALNEQELSFEGLTAVDLRSLDATTASIGGDLALAGSILWSDDALGWIAGWRLAAQSRIYKWQTRGVSFDDAFRNAVGGAAQVLSGNGQPN